MTQRWKNRPEGSTWGDWGEDDQKGRMNLLTPERVKAAAGEVTEGLSFCLSLPLDLPGGNAVNPKRHPPEFKPVFVGEDVYFNYVWDKVKPGDKDVSCDEAVTLYSQYSTQWDSLAHIGSVFDADGDGVPEPVYYNGFRPGEHVGGSPGDGQLGARALGIENMAETCVQGRGVMVDLHAHFGDERVAVNYQQLMEVFEQDSITVEEGDMLCLHTAYDRRDEGVDPLLELLAVRPEVDVPLGIAGGLKLENAADVVRGGADIVVVGGAIQNADDPARMAADIRDAMIEAPA